MCNKHGLGDLGHVQGSLLPERASPLLERSPQAAHLGGFPVNQHHMRRLQGVNELAGLREVGVC